MAFKTAFEEVDVAESEEGKTGGMPAGAWVAVLVLVGLGGGVGAYFLLRNPQPGETRPAPPVVAPAPTAAVPDVALPASESSDTTLRRLAEELSPKLAGWAREADLLTRLVTSFANLAEGEDPRKQLGFLKPEGAFGTVDRGGHTFMDPRSPLRFDAAADSIAAIDTKAAARAFQELLPLCESAYHKLGYPDRSFKKALGAGLRRIVAAPPAPAELELRAQGARFLFADPKLEGLGPIEKQLMRMGPRNQRLVQTKAAELIAALGL